MCGRATLTCSAEDLAEYFGVALPSGLVVPRFNITPSQDLLIVRAARSDAPGQREAALTRWGLIPHWAKDRAIGAKCAQARAETAAAAGAFRDAFRARRCVVAVDGYYEWRRAGGAAQKKRGPPAEPHWVHRGDGAPFALAGVWERWTDEDGQRVESCAVLTTEARGSIKALHHRMPVVVPREQLGAWIHSSAGEASSMLSELREASADGLECRAVSTRVNHPGHDDAACIAPADAAPPRPQLTFRFDA